MNVQLLSLLGRFLVFAVLTQVESYIIKVHCGEEEEGAYVICHCLHYLFPWYLKSAELCELLQHQILNSSKFQKCSCTLILWMILNWSLNDLKLILVLSSIYPWMFLTTSLTEPRIILMWHLNDPQMILDWFWTDPRMILEWSLNDSQMIIAWSLNDPWMIL